MPRKVVHPKPERQTLPTIDDAKTPQIPVLKTPTWFEMVQKEEQDKLQEKSESTSKSLQTLPTNPFPDMQTLMAVIAQTPALTQIPAYKNLLSVQIPQPTTSKQVTKPETQLPKPNPSSYIIKPNPQYITVIEKSYFEPNPFMTIQKLFGQDWYYKPWSSEKTPTYYQTILEVSASVEIKHFYLREGHTNPAYSTFKILHVIPPQDWEGDVNKTFNFPETYKNEPFYDTPFSYWDYQQAWYNSFYIQNDKSQHTWLIYFDSKSCNPSTFPYWFATQWWDCFGTIIEFLNQKPQVLDSYKFLKIYTNPQKKKNFSPLFFFFTPNSIYHGF